jgi:hypothetical protein
MQSMIASANGSQGKGAPLLAGILPAGGRDVDVGSGLSLKGKGFNADSNVCRLPQARPGARHAASPGGRQNLVEAVVESCSAW